MQRELLSIIADLGPFFVVCGLFGLGGGKKDDQGDKLDKHTIKRRLSLGLEDLSDADRRNGGYSSVDPEILTIEQAQMAAEILRKLGYSD